MSLEKMFSKNLGFKEMCELQISECINQGYTKKLSKDEPSTTLPITNWTPHRGVNNVNKRNNKIRVAFVGAAVFQGTNQLK